MRDYFDNQSLMRLGAFGLVPFLLTILSTSQPARAALDFTGDFSPGNWVLQPDLGTVSFNGAQTELLLIGPSGLPTSQWSQDVAGYAGPGDNGVPEAGTVSFNWSFNSGDAWDAQAKINWTGSGGPHMVASGGPGTIAQGSDSIVLEPGDWFSFMLDTGNLAGNKTPAEFSMDFDFATIPEVSTTWAGTGLLALLAGRRSRPKTCLAAPARGFGKAWDREAH